jgi:Leucine-rich repeat (LRR) protein
MKEITEQEFYDLIKQGVKDFNSYKIVGNVEVLYCSYNQLTSLPKLPHGLEVLRCSNNKLTSLPELPQGLEELYCYDNQLTSLPELPQGLKMLYCSNNQLVGSNYTISKTSGRSVYYEKSTDRVFIGCFVGTLQEFYIKGWEQ